MKTYKVYWILWLSLVFLFLGGCCHKEMVVLVPDEQGHVGKIEVTGEKGSVLIDEPWHSTVIGSRGAPGKVEKISPKKVETLFGTALQADPLPPLEYRLYFISGTDQIVPESMEQFPSMVKAILERGDTEISIIGHTDRTGTAAANLLLSKKRTKVVQKMLMELGVPGDELKDIRHYGESMPLIPTADGIAEPRNRRVEVFVR